MQPHAIIAFGENNQFAEVSVGDVAAGDIVKTYNTVYSPAPAPTIERHPSPPAPPRALRAFRDRELERGKLAAELRPAGGAWLRGAGGSGATALLRQVAATPASALPDGVALLDRALLLAAHDAEDRSTPSSLDDLAQLLFDRFYRSSDLSRRVRVDLAQAAPYLQGLQALFVFDRLPLARAQIAQLADLLASGAVCVAAPGPPCETLLDLPLRGLPRADAVALFAAAAELELDPVAMQQVHALCEELEDIPLALQLAAALVRVRVVALPQLAGAAASVRSETSALARAAQLALQGLDTNERALLAAVAVGAPDLDLEALSAIALLPGSVALPLLERLADLRLVLLDETRYAVASPSLRQELTRLLGNSNERARAAAFFAGVAALRANDATWLAREAQNLFRAAETASTQAVPGLVGPLVRALQRQVVLDGRWNAWECITVWARQAADGEGDVHLRAWALHEQGTRLALCGQPALGLVFLQQALQQREKLGDPAAALTRHNLRQLGRLPALAVPTSARRFAWLLLPALVLLIVGGVSLVAIGVGLPSAPTATLALASAGTAMSTLALAPTLTPTSTAMPTTLATVGSAPTMTQTSVPTSRPTITSTLTSTPDRTATAVSGRCLVVAEALNLRDGPATSYRVLEVLPRGTIVTPLAQAFGAAWFLVDASGGRGWISNSTATPAITCFLDPGGLPAGVVPPTYTPTPTRTPAPTATPTATDTATASATATPLRQPRPTLETDTPTTEPTPTDVIPQ